MMRKFFLWVKKKMDASYINQVKQQLKYCGNNVKIDPTCNIILPQRVEIGEHSHLSSFTTVYGTAGVTIGKNCLISSNCGISSVNHVIPSGNRRKTEHLDLQYCKPVFIGNNVWIGMNVSILPGITIGDNSIVGSGSVVTKNIPSNEIWAGNPARLIKAIDLIYEVETI